MPDIGYICLIRTQNFFICRAGNVAYVYRKTLLVVEFLFVNNGRVSLNDTLLNRFIWYEIFPKSYSVAMYDCLRLICLIKFYFFPQSSFWNILHIMWRDKRFELRNGVRIRGHFRLYNPLIFPFALGHCRSDGDTFR